MHELQSLLLQKLPRLGELTFGCEVKTDIHKEECYTIGYDKDEDWYECLNKTLGHQFISRVQHIEILGHPFTHAHLLEALGEDWAMQSGGQLWKYEKTDTGGGWTFVSPTWEEYPCLPDNISDLSLPEYEETTKQLIQLLTK